MDINDIFVDLLAAVCEYGEVPDSSVESEQFFAQKLAPFEGRLEEAIEYVVRNAPNWFWSVGASPQWVQEECWEYNNGEPMVFMGQVEVPLALGFFHDDARIFVFMDAKTSEVSTVFQIS